MEVIQKQKLQVEYACTMSKSIHADFVFEYREKLIKRIKVEKKWDAEFQASKTDIAMYEKHVEEYMKSITELATCYELKKPGKKMDIVDVPLKSPNRKKTLDAINHAQKVKEHHREFYKSFADMNATPHGAGSNGKTLKALVSDNTLSNDLSNLVHIDVEKLRKGKNSKRPYIRPMKKKQYLKISKKVKHFPFKEYTQEGKNPFRGTAIQRDPVGKLPKLLDDQLSHTKNKPMRVVEKETLIQAQAQLSTLKTHKVTKSKPSVLTETSNPWVYYDENPPYYRHSITGEYKWENPNESNNEPTLKSLQVELETDTSLPDTKSDWVQMYDPNSTRYYYYSNSTGVSTWDAPLDYILSSEDVQSSAITKIQSVFRGSNARR